MSISNTSQANTLIETEYDRGSETSHDDGWRTVGQRSWHTPSSRSQSMATTSNDGARGFDPSSYRASSRSMADSQRSFNSSVAERSDTISMSANGNFAKIKAYVRADGSLLHISRLTCSRYRQKTIGRQTKGGRIKSPSLAMTIVTTTRIFEPSTVFGSMMFQWVATRTSKVSRANSR